MPFFFFLFGDYQGSAQLMMSNEADPSTATVQCNAYTPYGAVREFDPDGSAGSASANPLTIERGWLSQVADEDTASLGTGLTYLNARYYDPVASRFKSPDALLDVMDPKTLDPYRYAENNPVLYTDVSGLYAKKDEAMCGQYGCAGKTDDPYTYGAGLHGRAATGAVHAYGKKCSGFLHLSCHTLDPSEAKQRLNHSNAEVKCAMGIATGSCEHINANTHFSSALTPGEVLNVASTGLLNYGIGFVNGASSMVNGLADMAACGGPIQQAVGMCMFDVPDIPSIGIVGDYDVYRWSAYSGTAGTFEVTAMVGGGGASSTPRVFWSGGKIAQEGATKFATANGGVTIGMTNTGRALDWLTVKT